MKKRRRVDKLVGKRRGKIMDKKVVEKQLRGEG